MPIEKPEAKVEDIQLVADADCENGLRIGVSVDEFAIQSLLGRGGVSEVYRALDTRTNAEVALKFLLPSRMRDKQSCARLRNEAKHIMDLRHRRIVSVIDVRESERVGPYIVMDLLHGKPLTECLPLSEKEALDVSAQVAEALGYSHSKGMIHRDIKPSNVMMLEDGTIRLVDFGLAKVFAGENPEHIPLTRTTEVVGTSLYMSPEQCFGQDVDARTDIYQLGCLLLQCITGFPPFEASTSFEAMYKHVSVEPDLHSVSAPVRSVLIKALDKNPDERFQSAMEMGLAIGEALLGRGQARRKSKSKPNRKFALAGLVAFLVMVPLVLTQLRTTTTMPLNSTKGYTATQLEAQKYYEEGLDAKAKGWTENSRAALSRAIQLDRGEIGFKALGYMRSHLPAHFQSQEAEQLNIKGYNLNFNGQTAEAEKVWLECIAQYPNFEWPYSNLGGQYLRLGQPAKAVSMLAKAIEINPYYTNALRTMSEAQSALGQRDLAIQYMQRAADSEPEELWYKQQVAELQAK